MKNNSVIGLDFDFYNEDFIREVIARIHYKYYPVAMSLAISPSGRGFHIRFRSVIDYTDDAKLKIRNDLLDDSNRIRDVGGRYRDVLFNSKLIDGKWRKEIELDINWFMKGVTVLKE